MLNLGLYTASHLLGGKVKQMTTKLETDGSNITLTRLPLLELKRREKQLLLALKTEKSVADLAGELKKNKTSVYRTLQPLVANSLIRSNNTSKKYSITPLGQLILLKSGE